jgi:hypothetical protein
MEILLLAAIYAASRCARGSTGWTVRNSESCVGLFFPLAVAVDVSREIKRRSAMAEARGT